MKRGIGIWKPSKNACKKCIKVEKMHADAAGNDCDNLNDEYVVFKNVCNYDCNIAKWKVKDDSSKNEYAFLEVILKGKSEVTLYSGCGSNSKTKLYWCNKGSKCNAIWDNAGDTVYMRDSNGAFILAYPYGNDRTH